ncbi:hypothetical protein ACVWYN_000561 [Pedobacter sp. UYP24]
MHDLSAEWHKARYYAQLFYSLILIAQHVPNIKILIIIDYDLYRFA